MWSAATVALVPSSDQKHIPVQLITTRNVSPISFYQWFFIPFLALVSIILFDKYPEIVWDECIVELVVQLLGNKKHIYESSFCIHA